MSMTPTELDREVRTLELAIQALRVKVDYVLTQTEEIEGDGQPQVSAEAIGHKNRWQTAIHQLIRELLGLEEDQTFDPTSVPSAAEIRQQTTQHIPEEEKFSDLIVAMREEVEGGEWKRLVTRARKGPKRGRKRSAGAHGTMD